MIFILLNHSLVIFFIANGFPHEETINRRDMQMSIFDETVQLFRSSFRSESDIRSGPPRYVGLENEYVMVSADGSILRPEVLDYLWQELAAQGWNLTTDHMTGKTTSALKYRETASHSRTHNYDVIATDLAYATLEICLAPAQSLQEAHSALCNLVGLVTSILTKHDSYVLGYGVQPITGPNSAFMGPKNRYALIFEVHEDENPGHSVLGLQCLNASCQTQVDVTEDEAIAAINALTATCSLRAALFANSPIWQNQVSDYKAIRHQFWDWCYANRKQQIGIPPRIQSLEHYVDYLMDFRSIVVCRDKTFYRLNNNHSFRSFMQNPNGQIGTTLDGQKAIIVPRPEDIQTQYGFAWLDARLHPMHGTIEDRISCQQLPQAHLCSSAMTLGLVENLHDLTEIADLLSRDQWRELRQLASIYGMNFSYPGIDVKELLTRLLAVAYKGLEKREMGEEEYLAPLLLRIETGTCPADEVITRFQGDGVQGIIALTDMKSFPETIPQQG
jgi:gamma-glutamylcysteine synthetase